MVPMTLADPRKHPHDARGVPSRIDPLSVRAALHGSQIEAQDIGHGPVRTIGLLRIRTSLFSLVLEAVAVPGLRLKWRFTTSTGIIAPPLSTRA
jgi:hypothetical protein